MSAPGRRPGLRLRDEVRRRWLPALLAIVVVAVLLATRVAGFYTDALWYASIGFSRVFWSLLGTKVALGSVAGLVAALLVGGNLLLARRLAPDFRIPSPQEEGVERYREALLPHLRPLLLGIAGFIGVLSGLSVVPSWSTFLLWANAQPFDRVDPQFGRDLGFFVFVLPFHELVNSYLFTALVMSLLASLAAHYVLGGIRPQAPGQKITPQANVHVSVLLAALVGVRAWGFRLDQFLLSYSERGQVTGLSYTDVHAQLPALRLLLVIAVVCLVLFLVNIRIRGWVLPTLGVGILLVAAVVLGGIVPAVVQRVQVAPQELERERPFIEHNLAFTRFGFGLDDVRTEPFAAREELSREEVVDNAQTLSSMRLWDPATALAAYEQLQELRPYYDFRDVDVDRYDIDGSRSQVLIGAREITQRGLPSDTWQNQHLVYTHGIGVVASQVSGATPDGQPVFLASDIPPSGVEALELDNPRIYFGEDPPDYSVVGTSQPELDFAQPEGPVVETSYDGEDGVAVGSFLRRLAFGLRFAEPNMVLSRLLGDESRVLFRRQVRDRVSAVAPFLKLDHDAYPVVADGRVQWVVDAYTTSDMVPYSERVDLGPLTAAEQRRLVALTGETGATVVEERSIELPGIEGRANYIRNSVKAVVDAYDGTVRLYVVDPADPMIAAWRSAFPAAFTDVGEASEDLRAHFRYPEDMFRVQAAVYRDYHIPGPDEFYTKEDAWRLPTDPSYQRNQPEGSSPAPRTLRPLYQLLRLPGETEEEFALLQPYTPRGENRQNLIAYLAASSDPDNYGQLRTFLMPPGETVFGPEQVQARIDQDEIISAELSLLNQRGSSVIYGNLLTIPVEDALLYAQPLFLRAEQSAIPVLAKVVLVFGNQIVMRDTLAQSLEAVFGVVPAAVRSPADPSDPGEDDGGTGASPPTGGAVDPRIETLISEALEAFADADAALRDGDLGRYQELTRTAQERLAEAQGLLEGTPPTATPAPGATATPVPTEGGG